MTIGLFRHINIRLGCASSLSKISLTRAENARSAGLWKYPSDHLPVFGKVDDMPFGTLNTLNYEFVHHLEKIEEWKESHLVSMSHTPSQVYPELSYREERICHLMERILVTEPCVDLMCLQEISDRMHKRLEQILEPRGISVIAGNGGRNNHVATLVNTNKYCLKDVQIPSVFRRYIQKEWHWDRWRPAVDITLESRSLIPSEYRTVNLHISSAGQDAKYKEDRLWEVKGYLKNIDAYVKASQRKDIPILLAGDLNACKSMTYEVFNSCFRELCEQYTQIESIPADHPHLVSIDSLLLKIFKETKGYHEARSVPLHETADREAAEAYRHVVAPLLADRS